jgi:hypothetical protein
VLNEVKIKAHNYLFTPEVTCGFYSNLPKRIWQVIHKNQLYPNIDTPRETGEKEQNKVLLIDNILTSSSLITFNNHIPNRLLLLLRYIPLPQHSYLLQPTPPRTRQLPHAPVSPHPTKLFRIQCQIPHIRTQRSSADHHRLRRRRNIREIVTSQNADFKPRILKPTGIVQASPCLDKSLTRFGDYDDVDVVEGGGEGVEVEFEAGVVEDDVDVVVSDVGFFARALRVCVAVCGHHGGDVVV